jgi:hypothetical protein
MYIALGLGFSIGTAIALDHLARQGELPMARGASDRSGRSVRTADAGAVRRARLGARGRLSLGGRRWNLAVQGRQRGAVLGMVTSPVALGLSAGFALPFLLAGVPMRVVLILAGRRDLR